MVLLLLLCLKNYQKTKTQDPTSNKKHLNTCQCLDYQVAKVKIH